MPNHGRCPANRRVIGLTTRVVIGRIQASRVPLIGQDAWAMR